MKAIATQLFEVFTPSRPRRGLAVAWLLTGAAVLATLFAVNPAASSVFPPCPFHALTGLLCPGCGSTRAVHALLHGEVATALALNPLLAVYAPILGYALLSTMALAIRGRALPQPRISARCIWLVLAAIVVFWVVRNTPLAP